MKSFLIIIAFSACVSGIRVPVYPENEFIKTSTPYGNDKQKQFDNLDLRMISVSSAPSYTSSSESVKLNRNNNENIKKKKNIRHNNLERISLTNSFLRPPPDATFIIHPAKTNDNYREKLYQREVDTFKSEHELPKEIPTQPIYPGESKWAKKGIKHYPHKSNVNYHKLTDNDPKPEGHEIFAKNEHVFDKQQNEFARELSHLTQLPRANIKQSIKNIDNAPNNFRNVKLPIEKEENSSEESSSNEEYEDDSEEQSSSDFVPLRSYSQVRETESESHIPRVIEEPRLRQTIKDSKIHTVYTEEGYEDSAYDHEGHEKKAENSEGYVEASGNKSKKPTKKFNNGRLENFKKEIENDASKVVDKYFSDEAEKKHIKESDEIDDDSSSEGSKIVIKKIRMEKTNKNLRRSKRFVNDFPKIIVDTDFIDEIRTNEPQRKLQQTNKYPYYNLNINKNSPLRYAEDLKNIPKKNEGEFSFYEQADKVQCEEVESDVNPIPEGRIRKAEKEETGENKSTPKTPRLRNLGDKIDCYKVKYFGEEPLDSPIFKEELVEPPEPIFKEFQQVLTNFKPKKDLKAEEVKQNSKNEQTKDEFAINGRKGDINTSVQEDIALASSEQTSEAIQHEDASLEEKDDFYDESLDAYKTIDEDHLELDEKPMISYQIAPINVSGNLVSETTNLTSNDTNREPKSSEAILESVSSKESIPTSDELLPETLPYRMQKRRKRPYIQQPYPIFDISRYIPPVPVTFPSSANSKYKTISEVYYKDEIKPDEQLNVFADVMNIIKNSTNTLAEEETEPVSVKLNTKKKEISTEYKPIRIKNKNHRHTITTQSYPEDTEDLLKNYYLTSTPYSTRKTTTPEAVYDEFLARLKRYQNKNEVGNDGVRIVFEGRDQLKSSSDLEPLKKVDDVVGLTPPIKESVQFTDQEVDNNINTYYFLGLRPPPKVRPISYDEYKPLRSNKIRRKAIYPARQTYRHKRETNSRAYASISRNQDDSGNDDDDYEPNRQRSFHYDVKTGKIIYDKTQEEPPIEYEEYEEEDEKDEPDYGGLIPLKEPIPISKKQTTTEGPPGIDFSVDRRKEFNYVEFVDKLKAEKNYVAYPDPTTTTTEKDATSATTTVPQKTTPPEFLNILSKVRSDDNYKEIKDKDEKKKKTTTPAPEEIEEEEEDDQQALAGVQNSPGGGQIMHLSNLQIFDISEYLPQVKSYTPRTNIDISKYKSIDRSQTRPPPIEESLSTPDSKINASIQRYSPSQTTTERTPTRRSRPHTTTDSTTTTTERNSPVTTQRKKIVRSRTRFTTPVPVSTAEDVTYQPAARHKKPTRVYPRRPHRKRIHTTPSPEEKADEETLNSSKERIQRRVYDGNAAIREQQIVPNNHKKTYTPVIVPEEAAEILDINLESQLAMPRVITPEIVAANITKINTTVTNSKESDVEVFAVYDPTKKHGGNYKRVEDASIMEKFDYNTKSNKLMEQLPVASASYYTDSKLPVKINQMKVDGINMDDMIVNESEEHDINKRTRKRNNNNNNNNDEYLYKEDVIIKFTNVNELTTKKPTIIKDPNKRLYFYAPL